MVVEFLFCEDYTKTQNKFPNCLRIGKNRSKIYGSYFCEAFI